MRVHVETMHPAESGRYEVFLKENGERLEKVIWADDDENGGGYAQYVTDEEGRIQWQDYETDSRREGVCFIKQSGALVTIVDTWGWRKAVWMRTKWYWENMRFRVRRKIRHHRKMWGHL